MKNKWIQRQQQIVNAARAAGRELTEAEEREFQDLQRKIDAAAEEGTTTGARSATPAAEDGTTTGARSATPAAEGGSQPTEGARTGAPTGADDAAQRAVAMERQRVSDITALCRETGMDPAEHIRSGATLDAVRAAAVTHLIQHGAPVESRARENDGDNFRQAATDALLLQAGLPMETPVEGANQFRGMSLRDIAIECMVRDGEGTTASLLRMGKDDLFRTLSRQFFNPTATFPAILDDAIRKGIVHQYQTVPTTFQLWTSKGSVSDFKPTKDHGYLVGGAGEFLRVGENGELKHDTPKSELLPQRKVDTYGRQFTMSRQAFINDDVGFITEVPGAYASAAKRTINKQVYKILVDNPVIFDGVPLFDSDHGNLVSAGSKPTAQAIQDMMSKLLLQTDPFGESIMVQPAYIIVPVGYSFIMTTIMYSPTINTTDNTQAVNPLYKYREQVKIVEEGAINALTKGAAAPWFMAGDKNYAKALQVDYLNGQETPTIRRSEVPGQLGYVWDIWMDWGITAVDFRGIARNNGVAIN